MGQVLATITGSRIRFNPASYFRAIEKRPEHSRDDVYILHVENPAGFAHYY